LFKNRRGAEVKGEAVRQRRTPAKGKIDVVEASADYSAKLT
jgi:hypothetical protein